MRLFNKKYNLTKKQHGTQQSEHTCTQYDTRVDTREKIDTSVAGKTNITK